MMKKGIILVLGLTLLASCTGGNKEEVKSTPTETVTTEAKTQAGSTVSIEDLEKEPLTVKDIESIEVVEKTPSKDEVSYPTHQGTVNVKISDLPTISATASDEEVLKYLERKLVIFLGTDLDDEQRKNLKVEFDKLTEEEKKDTKQKLYEEEQAIRKSLGL